MKKGFSLIIAIVFLVALATLGVLSLNIVMLGLKDTRDSYLYAQANLYMTSAIEYSVYAIQHHDYNSTCLDKIDLKFDDNFEGEVKIKYLVDYTHAEQANFVGKCSKVEDGGKAQSAAIQAVILEAMVKSVGTRSDTTKFDLAREHPIKITRTTTQIP